MSRASARSARPIFVNAALKESRSFMLAPAALESVPNFTSRALKSSMFSHIFGLAL